MPNLARSLLGVQDLAGASNLIHKQVASLTLLNGVRYSYRSYNIKTFAPVQT